MDQVKLDTLFYNLGHKTVLLFSCPRIALKRKKKKTRTQIEQSVLFAAGPRQTGLYSCCVLSITRIIVRIIVLPTDVNCGQDRSLKIDYAINPLITTMDITKI